jgi:hypothetical protein
MSPGPDGHDMLLEGSHISHCIDSIRQSLMCSSDISLIVWRWNETAQRMKVHGDIAHSCRNFDAIRQWAKGRQLISKVDFRQKTVPNS